MRTVPTYSAWSVTPHRVTELGTDIGSVDQGTRSRTVNRAHGGHIERHKTEREKRHAETIVQKKFNIARIFLRFATLCTGGKASRTWPGCTRQKRREEWNKNSGRENTARKDDAGSRRSRRAQVNLACARPAALACVSLTTKKTSREGRVVAIYYLLYNSLTKTEMSLNDRRVPALFIDWT